MALPWENGYYDSSDGAITVTQQKTGLAANTTYKVRLVARKDGNYAKNINFYGTATAKGG